MKEFRIERLIIVTGRVEGVFNLTFFKGDVEPTNKVKNTFERNITG